MIIDLCVSVIFIVMLKNINLIVACQKDGGISLKGKIPWTCPSDMRHFREITINSRPPLKNAVVMGRKTFDSIGKPLSGRINYVVTKNESLSSTDSIIYATSLDGALKSAAQNNSVDKIFVIGGADIYHQTLRDWNQFIDTTWLTQINTNYECDRHINLDLIKENHYLSLCNPHTDPTGTELTFHKYLGRNRGEEGYLNLMQRILDEGELRNNRTGIKTRSLFGERLVFDISERIPFITTKKLAWKTCLKETLFFISGKTDNAILNSQNVHIWDGNSSREYLDRIGLVNRRVGDLGPVYGFQWRHFGADYDTCESDYTDKGIDQLSEIIRLIKTDPTSRRIVLTAWNPAAQSKMVLPPCHMVAQWYVRKSQFLDCQMYQRSCDVALGVPFNIASYSMLTYMLAHVCGLQPGRYTQVLGDAHLYETHISSIKEQLQRHPHQFPRLQFARKVSNIEDFKLSDFIIHNYESYPAINMDMVV